MSEINASSAAALFHTASLWLRRHISSERGASLVEYSLLIALIAVVVIGSVTLFGGSVNSNFSTVASEVGG